MGLPWRLFISYAVVIAIGAAVAYVTVRLLAPTFFDHQMNMLGGDHMGMGMGPGGHGGPAGSVQSAFGSALTTALLFGVLASELLAAGLVAAFVTSRAAAAMERGPAGDAPDRGLLLPGQRPGAQRAGTGRACR